MSIRRILAATAAAVMVASGAVLAGASPASADQVWHQSIGRASAEAACPTDSPEDLTAGWTPWGASWEKWNNNNQGGYVCSRQITWAYDAPVPVAACTEIAESMFVLLDPSGFIPEGTLYFVDAACTEDGRPLENFNVPALGFAFTSSGQGAANAICAAAHPPVPVEYVMLTIPAGGGWYTCYPFLVVPT